MNAPDPRLEAARDLAAAMALCIWAPQCEQVCRKCAAQAAQALNAADAVDPLRKKPTDDAKRSLFRHGIEGIYEP